MTGTWQHDPDVRDAVVVAARLNEPGEQNAEYVGFLCPLTLTTS